MCRGSSSLLYKVNKWGDVDVGVPFLFHLDKEQKTLPTAEFSITSLIVLAWAKFRDVVKTEWKEQLTANMACELGFLVCLVFLIKSFKMSCYSEKK